MSEPTDEARATKRCPICAEDVWAEARICRYCRYEFPQAPDAASADREAGPAPPPDVLQDDDLPKAAVTAVTAATEAAPRAPALRCQTAGCGREDGVERCASCGTLTCPAHRVMQSGSFVCLACHDREAQANAERSRREEAEADLSAEIRRAMADGWAPGYSDSRSAVLYRGEKINHRLHAVMSWPIAFWFWYWVYVTLRHGGVHQMHLSVQRDGSVLSEQGKERTPRWVYAEWVALAAFQIWFALMLHAATQTTNPLVAQGVNLPGMATVPAQAAPTVNLPGMATQPEQAGPTLLVAPTPPPVGGTLIEQTSFSGVAATITVQGPNNCPGYENSNAYSFVLRLVNTTSSSVQVQYSISPAVWGGVAPSSDCYQAMTTGDTVTVPAGQTIDIGFRDTTAGPTDLTVGTTDTVGAHWVLVH